MMRSTNTTFTNISHCLVVKNSGLTGNNAIMQRVSIVLDTHNALCVVYDEFADEIKQVISQNAAL